MAPKVSPYGTWDSPIAKDLLASADNTLVDGFGWTESGTTACYYLENRAAEGGRQVIVRSHNGTKEDILPAEFNATSKVHEYGGAAFIPVRDGRFIFVDKNTQGVYYLNPSSRKVELIYQEEGSRFADFDQVSVYNQTYIAAVREKPKDGRNELVILDPATHSIITTISGADFYTNPKFSPDGYYLSWLQWNLEDMPWTGAQLFAATFINNKVGEHRHVAGEATKESISQPRWSSNRVLFFVSDRSGYYTLYKTEINYLNVTAVVGQGLDDFYRTEFSAPDWMLGARTYIHLTENLLVAAYLLEAGSHLAVFDIANDKWTPFKTPHIEINWLSRVSDTKFLLCGSTSFSPAEIVELDVSDPAHVDQIARSSPIELPREITPQGQSVVFPRKNGSKAYAWLWPPKNPDFTAPQGSQPPLIVHCHGGPTAHTGPGLDLLKVYWTSRGYAFASVNYGGSSGYGRTYRDALHGKWGELDASDVAAFAHYMCSDDCPSNIRTSIDQVGITGRSAGGYTVLRVLTVNAFPWKAGVSLYGIGNISLLEQDTHKFESRYTRILFDPAGKDMSDDERAKLYHDKSPQFSASHITAATLLLQGSEDKVVPLNQAQDMQKEIEKAGQPVKLVVYEGEGHGFRKAESIKDMLDQMEKWWRKYLVKE